MAAQSTTHPPTYHYRSDVVAAEVRALDACDHSLKRCRTVIGLYGMTHPLEHSVGGATVHGVESSGQPTPCLCLVKTG